MQVFLQGLGCFSDGWRCCGSQGLAANRTVVAQYPRSDLVSTKAFVWYEQAIKIVPSLICTCSEVLACGLLSLLLVILLLPPMHCF